MFFPFLIIISFVEVWHYYTLFSTVNPGLDLRNSLCCSFVSACCVTSTLTNSFTLASEPAHCGVALL